MGRHCRTRDILGSALTQIQILSEDPPMQAQVLPEGQEGLGRKVLTRITRGSDIANETYKANVHYHMDIQHHRGDHSHRKFSQGERHIRGQTGVLWKKCWNPTLFIRCIHPRRTRMAQALPKRHILSLTRILVQTTSDRWLDLLRHACMHVYKGTNCQMFRHFRWTFISTNTIRGSNIIS